MNRSILVVYRPAAGRYAAQFRSVVTAAAGLGVATVVLLPTGWQAPEAEGLAQYHADLDDPAAVRAAVDGIVAEHRVERIFPLFEGDVLPAARARRDHGIPGLTPGRALNFRDKNVMHRRAEELGVRVARSCRPDTIGAVEEFAARAGYPVVVKPYAGWACGRTYRVDGPDALARVWDEMGDDRHEYRVEEFVHGTEYHVDSLFKDGEPVFAQLSRYWDYSQCTGLQPGGEANLRTALTSAVCMDWHCSPQPGSERPVLLLGVLLHDAERCTAGRPGEVRAGPQTLCPPVMADEVGELLTEASGGHALEGVHQPGHGDLRREVHEEVDVVVLAVELDQLGLEVLAHGPHDFLAPRQVPVAEDGVPVLRHENQVDVHAEDAVATCTNVLIDTHKPTV